MIINPYKNVNWLTCQKVPSVSHAHTALDSYYSEAQHQLFFQRVVNGGIKHFALSNYYRSEPRYTLSDFYENVPADAISCPNAEHHNFATYSAMHVNSLGSFFESGSLRDYVDGHWVPRSPIGVNKATWKSIFPQILEQLQFSDGGGITINHPIWSSLPINAVKEMLDFDPRVLGIEIYNESSEIDNNTGWALDMWDNILITGRRCWGFCVPDHTAEQGRVPWLGRNILLVTEATERECLRAYREGRFYSRLDSTDLKFTSISFVNNTLSITTQGANTIKIIVDKNETTFSGNSASMTIPFNAVYARVEAVSDDDRIFSNPILLKERDNKKYKNLSTKFLLVD